MWAVHSVTRYCMEKLSNFPKIVQKVDKELFTDNVVAVFKIAQKVAKYLGYFLEICRQDLSKIAQLGHTGLTVQLLSLPCHKWFANVGKCKCRNLLIDWDNGEATTGSKIGIKIVPLRPKRVATSPTRIRGCRTTWPRCYPASPASSRASLEPPDEQSRQDKQEVTRRRFCKSCIDSICTKYRFPLNETSRIGLI